MGLNTWEAWNIAFTPHFSTGPKQYDQLTDVALVREDLRRIHDAGIDFIIPDLTNTLKHTFINVRAASVCERLRELRQEGRDLKVAVAVGGIQFPVPDPVRNCSDCWGWGYRDGSLRSRDAMVVMPGINNKKSFFVSRYTSPSLRTDDRFVVAKGWVES
jgi:hypothetical protein